MRPRQSLVGVCSVVAFITLLVVLTRVTRPSAVPVSSPVIVIGQGSNLTLVPPSPNATLKWTATGTNIPAGVTNPTKK